jgi:hypothetical protein
MMSRRLALAALASLWAGIATGEPTVDLNAPGALAALEQSNRAHYEKVRRILQDIVDKRDSDVPRWMQTTFAAHDVSYAPVLLTSDPPQRRLSFVLDTTRYQAIVTLTNARGHIVPLR